VWHLLPDPVDPHPAERAEEADHVLVELVVDRPQKDSRDERIAQPDGLHQKRFVEGQIHGPQETPCQAVNVRPCATRGA